MGAFRDEGFAAWNLRSYLLAAEFDLRPLGFMRGEREGTSPVNHCRLTCGINLLH